jgi:hypothetical protein
MSGSTSIIEFTFLGWFDQELVVADPRGLIGLPAKAH